MRRQAVTLLLSMTTAFWAACSTPSHVGETSYPTVPTPPGQYTDILSRWTKSEHAYNNLSEAYQITATLQSADIIEHQVYRDAEEFHWSEEQYKDERQKALFEAQSNTTFFVTVYTDKDDLNNLDKKDSIWNVFLKVGDKRISPTSIKRVYENKMKIIDKYPYVINWSRPYYITFPIPTGETQSGAPELTIAGTLGGVHLTYPNNN